MANPFYVHNIELRGGPIFGPKKCSFLRDENASKNCTFEQFESGPKLRIYEIYFHVLSCSFGPLSSNSNVHFWSWFIVRLWTKSTLAMHFKHVIENKIWLWSRSFQDIISVLDNHCDQKSSTRLICNNGPDKIIVSEEESFFRELCTFFHISTNKSQNWTE